MTSNTLVTVMLPTRNRVELVNRSVQTLLECAADPTSIEISIAYDHDDQPSKDYFNSTAWTDFINRYGASTQVFETPAWGYIELHNYYNLLASKAQGKWLLLWNDDALMQTKSWDVCLAEQSDFVGMLHMTTTNFDKKLTLFPFIPRTWIDIFGTLSLCNCNDSWIQDICHEAGAVKELPVNVIHDRFDVTGNNGDDTYQNRRYQKKIYKSDAMRQTRHEWALRFMEYRASNGACEPSIAQTEPR
jgi:hypothetical protein